MGERFFNSIAVTTTTVYNMYKTTKNDGGKTYVL